MATNGDSDKPKSDREILQEQMAASLHEYRRNSSSLFMSATAAGLEIGFSFFLMAVLYTLFNEDLGKSQLHLLLAASYPIGFVMVIIGRTDLFTEHTTLAILPVLDRRRSVWALGRVWGVIYSGNLLGALMFGLLLAQYEEVSPYIDPQALSHYGVKSLEQSGSGIFLGAVLAGWLMGLLGWVATSSQDTIGRVVLIILITFVIGVGGLAHCVAGSVAMFSGWLGNAGAIDTSEMLGYIAWATIGNTVGGSVFVGMLKYGYVSSDKAAQEEKSEKPWPRRSQR
ncbi:MULTISPECIES: formate/nitrite transporter family protein [Microbulbifer]|uniref:formate/nitrite transporter family protein n=1 Tax=Microbulbifer TaxID=48073 RepID=UPI001E2BC671|nr:MULTISPECIES: formate/nitrite transporter family protein [Microbulbifer]UHQ53974.1 formate/nitrite transporter family protein [Microbulbifer sp. YPW16]